MAVRACSRHTLVADAVGALAWKALTEWTAVDTFPLPSLPPPIPVGRSEPGPNDPGPSLGEGDVPAARRALAAASPSRVSFLEHARPAKDLLRKAEASFVRRDLVEWGREGALLVPARASLTVYTQHHESALQQACAGAEQKGFGPRDSGEGAQILGAFAGELGGRLNETSAHFLLYAAAGTESAAEMLFFATLLLVAVVDVIVPRRLVPAVRQLQRRKDEVIEVQRCAGLHPPADATFTPAAPSRHAQLLSQVPRPVVRRLRLRCEQREKDAATEVGRTGVVCGETWVGQV